MLAKRQNELLHKGYPLDRLVARKLLVIVRMNAVAERLDMFCKWIVHRDQVVSSDKESSPVAERSARRLLALSVPGP